MLRGLYTAASGLMAQQRRHDAVTNNIANLNTPGFKGTNTVNRSFPEVLLAAVDGPEGVAKGNIGKLSMGVFGEENLLQMMQGDLQETRRSQDLALVSDILVDGVAFDGSGKAVGENGETTYQPQAFFAVQTPTGEKYTRDGSFKTAIDGTLMTSDGLPVTGANGQPIAVDLPWDQIGVTATGHLVDRTTGEPLAGAPQLRIVRVDNPNLLLREGDGRFRYAGDPQGLRQIDDAERVEVKQGFLERSNVDPAQSSVDMMAALRAYEANQKVVQFYDRSLDKVVNEVGRV